MRTLYYQLIVKCIKLMVKRGNIRIPPHKFYCIAMHKHKISIKSRN